MIQSDSEVMTVEKNKEKIFRVEFSGDFTISASEIWPDGDIPSNLSVGDVVAEMKRYCVGKSDLIKKWDLENDLVIDVCEKDSEDESIELNY